MYRDTLDVYKVADDLYMDKNSNLYLLTEDRSDETGIPKPVLISRFYNGCEGDSTFDLEYTIDVGTFKSTGNFGYKDKNHHYYHHLMSDGGNFVISD